MAIKITKATDFTAKKLRDIPQYGAFKTPDGEHFIRVALCCHLDNATSTLDIPVLRCGGDGVFTVILKDAGCLVEPLEVTGTLAFRKM